MRKTAAALATALASSVLLGAPPAAAAGPTPPQITSVTVALADTGSWGCTYRLTVSGTARGTTRIDGQAVSGATTYQGDHFDVRSGAFTGYVHVAVPDGVTATFSAGLWKLRGASGAVLVDREGASGSQTCTVA